MMTFDQIRECYEGYIRAREVSDEVEWTETNDEKEEEKDDRGSKGKV